MTDFQLDENGDLVISGSDFAVTESTLQHQSDIILSAKGWWKHSPSLGVNLQSYVNENGTAPGLVRAISQELERDGMTVDSVAIGTDGIKIEAKYQE
ncbi:hypothetical protein [Dyadobacter frigoris]|uniref:Oxidase n=1 Tax=Dyadobacter frigoris TaxID=2576211 RepID=A0A4U6D128_9BACT|nr:hypothetical protein [Dyadobacter frigoris]TKT89468.1 hypothetical protein FDK13_24305 [Dyadobacter frigoris]